MARILRVFCQTEEPPSPDDILEWARDEEFVVELDEDTLEMDRATGAWDSFDMLVEDAGGVQLNCMREDGVHAMQFEELVGMFEAAMDDEEEAGEVNPVREHLERVTYIIELQTEDDPESSVEDVFQLIAQSLAGNEDGMLMVVGEGFYDADGELLMEIEE